MLFLNQNRSCQMGFWRFLQGCFMFSINMIFVFNLNNSAFAGSAIVDETLNISQLRSEAETMFSTGSLSEALALFSKVIELDPLNERNFYKRFRVYLKRGSYKEAIADLSAALKLKPKYKVALAQRAKLLRLLGRCAESRDDYISLRELDPKHVDLEQGLELATVCANMLSEAQMHFDRRSYAAARDLIGEVLDNIAEYYAVPLLLQKAQCNWNLGDYELVIADTGRILKLDSENMEALELRGQSYYVLAEIDMATIHFKEALKLNSEHRGCQEMYKKSRSVQKKINLGNELFAESKFESAAKSFRDAGEVDENHWVLSGGLFLKAADGFLKAEMYQECIEIGERAVKIDSNLQEAYVIIGDANMKLEQWERATFSYKKALEKDNNQEIRQKLKKAETALKQSKQKNYYKILGVSRDATTKQIKKAYHEMALLWHPDKWVSEEEKEKAEEQFQQVAEAYEVLSDPDLREKYNNGEEVFENQGGSQQDHPFPGGFHFGRGQTFRFQFN